MLQNFLDALSITSAERKLKRVFFTTGLKQYAVHQGRPPNPMYEMGPLARAARSASELLLCSTAYPYRILDPRLAI
jgi:hypothetical protein